MSSMLMRFAAGKSWRDAPPGSNPNDEEIAPSAARRDGFGERVDIE
jgi:hypothetical protein